MITKHWEHFAHVADMGIRGIGGTKEEAFAQAALAMTAVITDPANIEPIDAVDIHCEGGDPELIFVDWLNALIYEMSIRKMLFSRFDVTFTDSRLDATAWGETTDTRRHQPVVEIKGATYTALKVEQGCDGGWIAQCVVDV